MKTNIDKLRYLLRDNPNFKTAYYQVVNKEKLVIIVEVDNVNELDEIPFEFEGEDVVVITN